MQHAAVFSFHCLFFLQKDDMKYRAQLQKFKIVSLRAAKRRPLKPAPCFGARQPWQNTLKVSHACQLGQAAVGHFHKVPMEQVIVGCWHEWDRGSGADGPVLH